MIKHLNRNQLNVEKYDNCISNAINTRIYAYSWFLDVVCDSWDVLVEDDYHAVMPLPKRKKYGIHYIYLPPWTQQLGVFSSHEVEENSVHQFIKTIPKKYYLIDVFLNSNNLIQSPHINLRDNFILPLDKSYESLRKEFSKGRKSSCKQAKTYNLEIIEGYDHDKIILLFKQNKGSELNKQYSDYLVLAKLFEHVLQPKHTKTMAVVNSNKELIGGALFLKDNHRITYLFSAINHEGREKQAMSFLLDHLIEKNAESNYILDFEGSMVEGVAKFYKSFGAVKEEYFWYKRRLF